MSFKIAKFKILMEEMALLTEPECSQVCRRPHSCCDPIMGCAVSANYAQEVHGISLRPTGHPDLPFMGPDGCTVEPYLRPLCTVHTCEINSFGCKTLNPREEIVPDIEWTKEYFDLRNRLDNLMFEIGQEKQC